MNIENFIRYIFRCTEENTSEGGDFNLKKTLLFIIVLILLAGILIAGCAKQNNNPASSPGISPGINNGASATPGIRNNDGNQSPAATVTSSPGTAVSPQNNYSGSGNLGGASDIG